MRTDGSLDFATAPCSGKGFPRRGPARELRSSWPTPDDWMLVPVAARRPDQSGHSVPFRPAASSLRRALCFCVSTAPKGRLRLSPQVSTRFGEPTGGGVRPPPLRHTTHALSGLNVGCGNTPRRPSLCRWPLAWSTTDDDTFNSMNFATLSGAAAEARGLGGQALSQPLQAWSSVGGLGEGEAKGSNPGRAL